MYLKKTLYKRLVGMVSRNALNEIVGEVKRLRYLGNDPSSCGCVMRSTLGLPCAYELSKYMLAASQWIQSICSGGDFAFQTKGYVRPKSASRKRFRPYLKVLRNLMCVSN